jgi:roadblock/LC7 domain-containing protein
MRQLIENVGGRRFIATVGAGVVTSILQWFGKLDPSGTTYAMVILGTVGVFITGNTAQKVMSSKPEATP